MRDSLLQAEILLHKFFTLYSIPQWNDSNDESVFICNEEFSMADCFKFDFLLHVANVFDSAYFHRIATYLELYF